MNNEIFGVIFMSILIVGLALFGYSLKKILQRKQTEFEYRAQEYFVRICEPIITRWTPPNFLSEYYSISISGTNCLVLYKKNGTNQKIIIEGIYEGNEIYEVYSSRRYSYNQFQTYIWTKVQGEYVREHDECIQTFKKLKKNA